MFHDVRFPASLSFGSVGGPERRTEIVTLANGYEERNTPWEHARRHYDAGMGLRSLDDVEALIAFFEARRGPLHAFRWKDWADYKSSRASADPAPTDQLIAVGDGTTAEYQLVKNYISGAYGYARPITKPVEGTVSVSIGHVPLSPGQFSVDHDTGRLTLAQELEDNAELRAGYEFDVPVRFDTNRIETSVSSFQAGDVPNVPIVEVRV